MQRAPESVELRVSSCHPLNSGGDFTGFRFVVTGAVSGAAWRDRPMILPTSGPPAGWRWSHLRGRCATSARYKIGTSVPIPKFASLCGTLVCELRN